MASFEERLEKCKSRLDRLVINFDSLANAAATAMQRLTAERRSRLQKLMSINAPEQIIEKERSLLKGNDLSRALLNESASELFEKLAFANQGRTISVVSAIKLTRKAIKELRKDLILVDIAMFKGLIQQWICENAIYHCTEEEFGIDENFDEEDAVWDTVYRIEEELRKYLEAKAKDQD